MTKSVLAVIAVTALTTAAMSRGPAPATPAALVDLTGTWTGKGHDHFIRRDAADGMRVTWVLTQTGATVSGTVVSNSLVSGDGSCSSCHRVRTGTISGTVSGTSFSLSMDFPGHSGEPTPACTETFTGTASDASGNAFTLFYSGGDSCENLPGQSIAFDNGTLVVARFTDDPLAAAETLIRAVHVTDLRSRIDALRTSAGLAAYSYVDATISAGTPILAQHIADLRTALSQVYVKLNLTPPTYTDDPLTAGTAMKAVHISEIRAAVVSIE